MTYEQEFLKDFEAWVVTQVKVNETALAASKKIWEEDGDERARDASAYNFLIGKFANYRAGKGFHDMPDGLFGERHY